LEYATEQELGGILSAFGLKSYISKEQTNLIHSIAGGHLELLRQLVDYFEENRSRDESRIGFRTSPGLDVYMFLHRLIKERLAMLGAEGKKTLEVLIAASVIGRSFTSLEINCITGAVSCLAESLLTAEKMRFLEREKDSIRFSHEAVRDAILKEARNKAPEYHATFAKCLSILRPSDYLTRAEHMLLGGQEDLAAQLYFIGMLKILRECEPIKGDFQQRVCVMMNQFGYEKLYSSLISAYDLYHRQHYTEAAALLDRVELIYPEVLLAERDYLLALCKLKKFNSLENTKVDKMLLSWDHLRDYEQDLWCRIQMTRLAVCTRNNDFDQARAIERNLGIYYNKLRRSDPNAETAINILRRKSATLYGAEIATDRCRTAVDFFGAGNEEGLPRSPVQYYMGLCNLSGNLLVIGEFVEARQTAERAANFWRKCQDLAIPRLEVAINNLLVSSLISGALNAKDAEHAMKEMDFNSSDSPDKYLLANNLIIFTAFTGNLDEALQQAMQTFSSLGTNTSDDNYYRYFIGTNLAGILHLTGKTRQAITLWRQLHPPKIPQADMPFLNARHVNQRKAFKSVKKGDIKGWDQFLSRHSASSLGRPWAFYGRGFLFSDIQFWSES
jgi:tetratricopeptide (TPR) repeat protein